MSETQLLDKLTNDDIHGYQHNDVDTHPDDDNNVDMKIASLTTPNIMLNKNDNDNEPAMEQEEDLEDGEIDDDDDDDDDDDNSVKVVVTSAMSGTSAAQHDEDKNAAVAVTDAATGSNTTNTNTHDEKEKAQQQQHNTTDNLTTTTATTSESLLQEQHATVAVVKSKKPQPVEDDHASSIENAIASALKKKGIEPPMPKIFDSRNGQNDKTENEIAVASGQSRNSRRRKRKKQRDEKEKEKERKEKKKQHYESPERSNVAAPQYPPDDEDDDMDDYEMLNVRGGSPPPISHIHPPPSAIHSSYKDQYDSADDSCSSYDSYDSLGPEGGADGTDGRRRRRAGKKESRKRRERGGGVRRDEDRNGRKEKRTRRDSPEDKHRQEPRKLELCKFYLMECCAKKDKCSYMHSDFPCKFYYLGMDCVYKEECKFSHGRPLSEQLRNILLKHLETAPKEILGNFKRISREHAIAQITKRHEDLCREFDVENVWSPMFSNMHIPNNRRGDHQQQQQQQHQQQMQQQQQQQQQQSSAHPNIPSLLDIKINPPLHATLGIGGGINAGGKGDKQRKSRWTDTSNSSSHRTNTGIDPPSNDAPSYLDLKNLTGLLSAEHISKLSQLGIVNLEQVNQLTFGQLNQIGLTIAEISEIQLNAINMSKLGVAGVSAAAAVAVAGTSTINSSKESNSSSASLKDSLMKTLNKAEPEKDVTVCSSSNSNSSSGVVMVDYSQYLKDSNLSFDRVDMYDDEKDEEQLVIDDGNTDNDDNIPTAPGGGNAANEEKHSTSITAENKSSIYRNNDFSTLRIPDISSALKNPFNIQQYTKTTIEDKKDKHKSEGSSSTFLSSSSRAGGDAKHQRNPFKVSTSPGQDDNYSDDEYYNRSRSRSQTPTRSNSSTPDASSQSPEPLHQDTTAAEQQYERSTMYDFNPRQLEEDELRSVAKSLKSDKDMRFLPTSDGSSALSDIDLRLPFQPVTNYTPATEIDGSITSHLPMTYKVYEVEVSRASYMELRHSFKSDQTTDPRLRRILGLPELSQTKTSAALSRNVRKLSNSIASPESEGASPQYYTPPCITSQMNSLVQSKSKIGQGVMAATTITQPRLDPRRAAAAAVANTNSSSQSDGTAGATATNTLPATSSSPATSTSSSAMKQNVEIRNLLQKSEWYKNLNSKYKIMVNQQLALVSTELKKFHQDTSPNKIFDISFILNNATLQQILTHLGIFIDDNGEVEHVDGDNDETNASSSGITLPNLSQPPPQQQQLDFLRAPPPVAPHVFRAGLNTPPPIALPPFGPPPNARPSLLGLPPGTAHGNPFNPFAVGNNFVGGAGPVPGIMGPGPVGFGNFGGPPNMQQQQRNFGGAGNQQRNHHRNPQIRRI